MDLDPLAVRRAGKAQMAVAQACRDQGQKDEANFTVPFPGMARAAHRMAAAPLVRAAVSRLFRAMAVVSIKHQYKTRVVEQYEEKYIDRYNCQDL